MANRRYVRQIQRLVSPLAAVSFNRSDSGTLGNTDNVLVGRPGGSGRAWVTTNGDWAISSNTLNPSGSAPAENGKYVAGIDLGIADVVCQARYTPSGATKGPAIRIAGLNSFLFAFARTTDNTLKIADCQADTISALASVAITTGTNELILLAAIDTKLTAIHQNGTTGVITTLEATSSYNWRRPRTACGRIRPRTARSTTGAVFSPCVPISPFQM